MVKLSLLFCLFLVFILPAVLSLGIRYIPENSQPPMKTTRKIFGLQTVDQLVIPQQQNFSGVGVSLKNPNLRNKKDITLSVFSQNSPDSWTLEATTSVNGNRITDGGLVKFYFPSIATSANKTFKLNLAANSASENEALEVLLADINQSAEITTQYPDVAYMLFYKPQSALQSIISIYSGWWQKWWSDIVFAVIYILVVVSGVLYLGVRKNRI